MTIINPPLIDGFDQNQTNTSEPSASQQTDGYATNEIPLASNHAYMFNQWYANFHYLFKNGFYQWNVDEDYNQYSFTMTNGKLYQSQNDSNQGSNPTIDSGANWQEPFITTNNDSSTKKGSLTIGEELTITGASYSGTTITVTVDNTFTDDNLGDNIYISGVTDSGGEIVNGIFTIDSYTSTTVDYIVPIAPTGTLSVSSAILSHGNLTVNAPILNLGRGVPYEDPDAIGANSEAMIYNDGTIVGSTDNGNYIKYPSGILVLEKSQTSSSSSGTTLTFPIEFIDTTYKFSGNAISTSTTSISVKIGTKATGSAGAFNALSPSGRVQISCDLIFIGRWK